MGIRGLKKYLSTKLNGVISGCVIPANSTLVIDGDGWLFQLIEISFSFRPELGGCYEALDASISAEIQRLRSCGLKLLVFFDGPDQRMKAETAMHREDQRKEQWQRFYEYCEESVRLFDQDSFPIPSLCKQQLISTLKSNGVSITQCSGEADQEIAKHVCAGNAHCEAGRESFFAYGRDSDYLVMRACPYIEFGTIEAVPAAAAASSSSEVKSPEGRMRQSPSKAALLRQRPAQEAQCSRVWRRSEVSEALGVTEQALLDFAVAAGNDYTAAFDRATAYDWVQLGSISGSGSGCGVAAVAEGVGAEEAPEAVAPAFASVSGFGVAALDALLGLVAGLGRRLRASPTAGSPEEVAAVQMAIDFSVAVYELQPLGAFPLDSAGVVVEREGEEDLDEEARLRQLLSDERAFAGEGGFVSPAQVLWRFRSYHGGASEQIEEIEETEGEEGKREEGSDAFFRDLRAYATQEAEAALTGPPRPRLGIAEHAVSYLRGKAAAEVSAEHLQALDAMLQRLYADSQQCRASAASTPVKQLSGAEERTAVAPSTAASFPHRPRWRDVVAAHAYQRACHMLRRLLPVEAVRGKRNGPRDLYQGVYFHSALRSLQGATSAAAPAAGVAGEAEEDSPFPDGCIAMPAVVDPSLEVPAEPVEFPAPTAPLQQQAPGTAARAETLPIDAFREEILTRIQRDRVTIIHGETGCGKSSCLPAFLLEHAEGCSPPMPCQIMVSQPRRIAVTSLLRRLRQSLGDKVGMRMGHGVRDDSPNTRIHYVTTGYLVRALAHQPQSFSKVTHLVIDEVHERSVDGDLVCLLARDLLRTHPSLRVILMSATIHTSLYRDYFAQQDDGSYGAMDCLSVGVRRFPIDICYPEDVLETPARVFGGSAGRFSAAAFAPQISAACRDIAALTSVAGLAEVPQKLAAAQYKAAVGLVRALCVEGTGVLIFVSGINDITELVQLFEPFAKFLVFPIHSDIPADEQELAFGATPADKVKVVVATNAAESSVTIPDCDMVICLGTHKALQYSSISHRTQLVNTFISKASATQRAGRTGRVRPGRVFRLYSRKLFEGLREHEVAEVHRRPLQDVVLSMWVMLEDAVGFNGVTPFLQGLIEAPDLRNIQQSYQHLYESDLVTHPSDEGFLTAVGRLAGELPVDIALGRMIAYGVILGVAAEAVVLAAALTLPKSPFRFANAMYNGPEEFLDIVRTKFLAAQEFDGGAYSEPIALLNLLRKWRTLEPRRQADFCHKRGMVMAVMKQFKSMADHLAHSVSTRLRPARDGRLVTRDGGIDLDNMELPDSDTLNLLRLILFWSSSGNVLRMKDKARRQLTDTSVLVHSNEVTEDQLRRLFGPDVPHRLQLCGKRVYDARLSYWSSDDYFRPLVRVLDGLAAIAAPQQTDCFWVVVKSDYNQATLVAMVVPCGPRLEGVLGLLVTHVFPQEGRLVATGRSLAEAIEDSASRLRDSVVLVIPDASKSEVRRLNDFRDLLESSLSLLIPVVGTAKLTASNCCPSDVGLHALFFGDEAPAAAVAGEARIACQITGSRCVISFPEEDGGTYDFPGEDGGKYHEYSDSDDNSEVSSVDTVSANRPLIEDLPLGHRLLNCCQQQIGRTKTKHLVLRKEREQEGGALRGASRAAVPGSMRYAQEHVLQAAAIAGGGAAGAVAAATAADERLEVRVDCVSAAWQNLRALKTTPSALNAEDQAQLSSIQAILSRQTLLSCSYHRGPESLFAVCHTSLLLGAAGNLAACEGVTFLPPGPDWVFLALLCAGADASQLLALCPDVGAELQVSAAQAKCAERIAELMRGASAIVPRPDIAQLVSDAFDRSLDADEGRSDFSGDSGLERILAGLALDDNEGHRGARKAGGRGGRGGGAGPPSAVPLVVQQQQGKLSKAQLKQARKERAVQEAKAVKKEKQAAKQQARAAAKQEMAAKKQLQEKEKVASTPAVAATPQPSGAKKGSPKGAAKAATRTTLTPTQVLKGGSKKKPQAKQQQQQTAAP